MQRRQAIRDMALISGGLLALPAWARAWTTSSLPEPAFFSITLDRELLSTVINAILPGSQIPGAVELGVPAFVELMLADCQTKEEADNVQTGLRFTESIAQRRHNKSFNTISLVEQQAILTELEKGNDQAIKDYYKLVKDLTIQGYTSSQYVQTNYFEYEMAPGYYHGCVPVKQ